MVYEVNGKTLVRIYFMNTQKNDQKGEKVKKKYTVAKSMRTPEDHSHV